MANECFARELKRSIETYPEFHYFGSNEFKDLFTKSKIEVYEGISDYDFLICCGDLRMYADLYGYPEAGHCAYFPTKDYEFRLDGTDENLYTKELPERRNYIANYGVGKTGIFTENIPVLEVFNLCDLESQIRRIWNGLHHFITEPELQREYDIIKSKCGDILAPPVHNKIIKYFQPHIFHNQQGVYQNLELRRKLIQNRMKYRFKLEHELTDTELISGCKIASLCQTYSYFSPLWFKYFIEKYKPKRVYDPFGGWGHRLLGSHNLDLYIYNDISKLTYSGMCDIVDYFGISNVELHCEDAETFKPQSKYDAVFTCPPYDNVEVYENEIQNFPKLMEGALNCGDVLYGIIILEKYENLLPIKELIEKTPVNTSKSHFGKSNYEHLYVFK